MFILFLCSLSAHNGFIVLFVLNCSWCSWKHVQIGKLFIIALKMLNANKFLDILRVCSHIGGIQGGWDTLAIVMTVSQLPWTHPTLIFLSHALYACLLTRSDSDTSVLSLCCLTGMFHSLVRSHVRVAFEEQVKLWQFVLPHFFFQFKG